MRNPAVPSEAYAKALAAVQRVVSDPAAPDALASDARRYFSGAGLDDADALALAAQPAERVLLYRELVREGIAGAVRKQIPRTAARLDAAFGEWIERFCDEELPRSHYVRDVPFEFVAWAASRWAQSARVAPWLGDLARHELCAFDVAGAPPCERRTANAELGLDATLAFDASVRLARYAWAVHRLQANEAARDEPAREATYLLAYRDAEHDVRYLEVTPLAAAILERLLAGRTLRDAVGGACVDDGRPVSPDVVSGVAGVLADLAERGALLGASTP